MEEEGDSGHRVFRRIDPQIRKFRSAALILEGVVWVGVVWVGAVNRATPPCRMAEAEGVARHSPLG